MILQRYSRNLLSRLAWLRLRADLRTHLLAALAPEEISTRTALGGGAWERDRRRRLSAQPLIIIGSHRSGITLITRALAELGLHIGATYSPVHYESYFFQDLNRVLFRAGLTSWEAAEKMREALANEAWCNGAVEWILNECHGPGQVGYLGWGPWLRGSRIPLRQPWGWKDPLNTYTLPLWLRVFPQARVLHVYRNGVDVSQSLLQRQIETLRRERRGGAPPRCLTLEGGFRVWEEYVTRAREGVAALEPARVLEICYEEFLREPASLLDRLTAFAGLQPTEESRTRLLASLRADRAYAFTASPTLYRFYSKVEHHPLMQELGYGGMAALPSLQVDPTPHRPAQSPLEQVAPA